MDRLRSSDGLRTRGAGQPPSEGRAAATGLRELGARRTWLRLLPKPAGEHFSEGGNLPPSRTGSEAARPSSLSRDTRAEPTLAVPSQAKHEAARLCPPLPASVRWSSPLGIAQRSYRAALRGGLGGGCVSAPCWTHPRLPKCSNLQLLIYKSVDADGDSAQLHQWARRAPLLPAGNRAGVTCTR